MVSRTCSTGLPGAHWSTGCCSESVNCCCMTPRRACCWSRWRSWAGLRSTATCRGAAGLLWWSERVVDEVGHAPPHLKDLRVGADGIHAVRQQDNEEVAIGVEPDGR